MKKKIYWVLLGLGIALMLFYSVIAILKAYTDLSLTSWIFKKAQVRLVIFALYTIAVLMLKTQITGRK